MIPQALEINEEDIERVFFWHPMIRGEQLTPRHRSESQPAFASAASMVHIDTDVGAYGMDGILELVTKNLVDPQSVMMSNNHDPFSTLKQQPLSISSNQRFVFLNIWRPLVPVRSRPLAIWAVKYNETNGMFPKHQPYLDTSRWYIFPNMEPSECLIFKQYDRRLDQSCDFWHTSLDILSKSADGLPLRKSFDMKAIVILKEKVPPQLDRLAASITPGLTLDESANFCAQQAKRRKLNN